MSEQEKREKVIKGLECCSHEDIGDCNNCPYNINDMHCDINMMRDVLELLKAQELRVMTLDEYRAIAELPRSERVPVWIEWRDGGYGWAIPQRAYEGYGATWRAWTDGPTDEMSEATAWN